MTEKLTEKNIPKLAAEALGYPSYEHFQENTGLAIRVQGLYSSSFIMTIDNSKDMFYKSYSTQSVLNETYNPSLNPFSNKLLIDKLKSRVKAKIKQQRLIEEIKHEAVVKVKTFIIDSFKIDPELVTTDDIIFEDHSQIKIANLIIWFHGTLTDKVFELRTSRYASFKEQYRTVMGVLDYYKKKKEQLKQ